MEEQQLMPWKSVKPNQAKSPHTTPPETQQCLCICSLSLCPRNPSPFSKTQLYAGMSLCCVTAAEGSERESVAGNGSDLGAISECSCTGGHSGLYGVVQFYNPSAYGKAEDGGKNLFRKSENSLLVKRAR